MGTGQQNAVPIPFFLDAQSCRQLARKTKSLCRGAPGRGMMATPIRHVEIRQISVPPNFLGVAQSPKQLKRDD